MRSWIFVAFVIWIPTYCHRLNEIESELDQSRRALLYSRYDINDEEVYRDDLYDVIEEEDEYLEELEDELSDLESFINALGSLSTDDLRYYLRMIGEEVVAQNKATKFHVLFARHPYTLQNQNLLNSFRSDIAAAYPIGRYQLVALRDHFLSAVEHALSDIPVVYDQLSRDEYRLDISPLRRAVLTALMMAQNVYDKTHGAPKYGIVLDRRLQEYHPQLCRHSKQPQCAVNRLKLSTLQELKRLHDAKGDESDKKILTDWLKYGYINRKHKGQQELMEVLPNALDMFLNEMIAGKVDMSSIMDKNGVMRNKMSAKSSRKLLKEWTQNIGVAHDLANKATEPVIVVGGHSESLKDLMNGGIGVKIAREAKEAYDAALCGHGIHSKVCNCQLVYFEVDLASGEARVTRFKSIWKPSDVDTDYIRRKEWKEVRDPEQLKTA